MFVLQIKHIEDYNAESTRCQLDMTQPTIAHSLSTNTTSSHTIDKYSRDNKKQTQFETDLLKMVSKYMLPLSVVERQGFQEAVTCLDPRINVVSRRTLGRRIAAMKQNTVLPSLSNLLLNVPEDIEGSGASRHESAVLGGAMLGDVAGLDQQAAMSSHIIAQQMSAMQQLHCR